MVSITYSITEAQIDHSWSLKELKMSENFICSFLVLYVILVCLKPCTLYHAFTLNGESTKDNFCNDVITTWNL
jgi:hypothetical protein